MSTAKLVNVNKIYPNKVQAVFDFNLEVKDKEFIVFVGPSGCGKSTTLRMIAGLEEISSGELYIDDEFCNYTAPKDRNIAMVFQSYALYPHMTVYDNMAFGLKMKKTPKNEIKERIMEAAKILDIEQYLDRKPRELSGGQRQRVALGRAIVRNAKIFLMDEPLSNLDAKLRVAMRSEIIKLHQKIGATTIYVTHDQTEAMTMADRIVVMKEGYIQQIGTPKEIYNHPYNQFVASFIGSPAMNFINGVYKDGEISFKDLSIKIKKEQAEALKDYEGKEIIFGCRPEDILIDDPSSYYDTEVDISELLGSEVLVHFNFDDVHFCAKTNKDIEDHTKIKIAFNIDKIHAFDKDTELAIFQFYYPFFAFLQEGSFNIRNCTKNSIF